MIIVKVIGGLGNQMFQYALGHALSINLGVDFKLDISSFYRQQIHNGFELEKIFNCKVDIATQQDINNILSWQSLPIINKFIASKYFSWLRKKTFIIEPHYHYWEKVWNIPDNSYLVGYWQSEKYFKNVKEQINKDFIFKSPLDDKNIYYTELIQKYNSVSIHVRRGDYIKNVRANKTHGICGNEYYDKALAFILKKVKNPHFFIFSDDIAQARSIIKRINSPYYFVDNNKEIYSYNDMRLMSLCKNNIIANSSFSWWAAWLNSNQGKIIIAPKQYIADKSYNIKDLFPLEWVKI
jgi:hypothetical protein